MVRMCASEGRLPEVSKMNQTRMSMITHLESEMHHRILVSTHGIRKDDKRAVMTLEMKVYLPTIHTQLGSIVLTSKSGSFMRRKGLK